MSSVFGVLKAGNHGLRGVHLPGKFGLSQTRILSHLAHEESWVNLVQAAPEGLTISCALRARCSTNSLCLSRSNRNALKSGIFPEALLARNESRAEYASLLNGLREDLQPQGTLETALIENLAAITWRRRRLVQAENAEIEKATRFKFLDSIGSS